MIGLKPGSVFTFYPGPKEPGNSFASTAFASSRLLR